MPSTGPDWPHLVVLMALGNGPDPQLRGVVRVAESLLADEGEPSDFEIEGAPYRVEEDRVRVFKSGALVRRETLDGRPISVHGRDTVWTWEPGHDAPVARPAATVHFSGPDQPLTTRRRLDEWSGDDFTKPAGPAVATSYLGRDAWQVEILPPPHKLFPLTLVVDAATGLVLSQRNDGWRSATEWVELEVGADVSDDLFSWDGPTRPAPDRAAERDREIAERRAWLDRQGVATNLALETPVELMLHEWGNDGSFHASIYVSLNGSLLRRPHSDQPWQADLRWPHVHEWSSAGWDWLFGSAEELSPAVLDRLKRQLG
jgi:hypothetical protein